MSSKSEIRNQKLEILAVVLARGGSKGLPCKNKLPLAGKPLLAWTLEHAMGASSVDVVALSTDDADLAKIGRDMGVHVIDRPADLASDDATVDSAARHAVEAMEAKLNCRFRAVVILYGNIPLRPRDLTDRSVAKLLASGADSVQSVYNVGKNHPLWMKKLGGPQGDKLEMYDENAIYRRQDLPPVYMLDGGIIAVTRTSLFNVVPGQPHAFLGPDRRAVINKAGDVVDIDEEIDIILAETILKRRGLVARE